jgi:hypothetical protein
MPCNGKTKTRQQEKTMAHFYAGVHGNRQEATRLGTKSSGISAFINGWHNGVKVRGWHEDGTDRFNIWATSGSGYAGSDIYIGRVVETASGFTFEPAR